MFFTHQFSLSYFFYWTRPLPQGTYTLGNMYTFKGMPYCYDLYPAASNNMCGRSGFLIHGGGCSGNPSEGCIVIESESTRYMIKVATPCPTESYHSLYC